MARVIISAGHTTEVPGTVVGDLREVDISRKIAKSVIGKLRSLGIITLSVPYDLPLDQRLKWINNTGYKEELDDILVEIHSNEGGKSGIEAWYFNDGSGKSKKLATTIANHIKNKTGLEIQSISDEKTHEIGSIQLLSQTQPVAVLLECLYLDNEQDQKFLKNDKKIDILVTGIVDGISKYLNIDNKQEKKESEKEEKPRDAKIQDTLPKPFKKPVSEPVKNDNNINNNNAFNAPDFGAPSFGNVQNNNFGMSGNNNTFGGGFGGGNSNSNMSNKPNMTRDERKEMVTKLYKKGLGREPEQSELNYFLNIGISEDQMYKRIFDSQDHVDMVENSKKYKDLEKKADEFETKSNKLEKQLSDQKAIFEKLNSLLLQKNTALSQLQKKLMLTTQKLEDVQKNRQAIRINTGYKGTALDQIFDYFSRRLS